MFAFDVGMFENFYGAYPRDWVGVEHLEQQVHEDGVFVESVALVLLESALQVFQDLALLLQNLLALAALHAEDAHAEQLFVGLSLRTALHAEPEGNSGQKLQQNGSHRPHIV